MNYAAILRAKGYEPYDENTGGHFLLRDDGNGVYIAYWNHPTDPKPDLEALEELDGYKYLKRKELYEKAREQLIEDSVNPNIRSNKKRDIRDLYDDALASVELAETKEDIDKINPLWPYDVEKERKPKELPTTYEL